MKRILTILILLVATCTAAMAELRQWTLKDGRIFEAEFVHCIANEVTLRDAGGEIAKVPIELLSPGDRTFVELELPPTLELEFAKNTEQRSFPDSLSTLPRSIFYEFTAKIRQTSTDLYPHELEVEFFAIGDEIDGDKSILLDRQRAVFTLNAANQRSFEFSSKRVELLDYVVKGQRRGTKYGGYLVVVADERGRIIAHAESNSHYFDILENLRKLPVGKTFNEFGERCFPTRPKQFY